jgi:iron-sulfur cluster assembly protein
MKEKNKISPQMTIDEIFATFPERSQHLAQIMAQAGLNCVGCQAATWETLESGVLGHGYSEEEMQGLIDQMNEVIATPIDSSKITMTKRAAEKFKQIAASEGKEGSALRFADRSGGCGGFEYELSFSKKPTTTDQIFHSFGVDIHVDQGVVGRLLGSEIDYLDGLNGAGFKVTNPNVKRACGCGNSQSYTC